MRLTQHSGSIIQKIEHYRTPVQHPAGAIRYEYLPASSLGNCLRRRVSRIVIGCSTPAAPSFWLGSPRNSNYCINRSSGPHSGLSTNHIVLISRLIDDTASTAFSPCYHVCLRSCTGTGTKGCWTDGPNDKQWHPNDKQRHPNDMDDNMHSQYQLLASTAQHRLQRKWIEDDAHWPTTTRLHNGMEVELGGSFSRMGIMPIDPGSEHPTHPREQN